MTPFRGDELVVGRAPNCDLVFATAGVSRKHARFVREGECFRVFDLGSANGVRVNGERLTERLLQVGDVVGIDDYTLTFVIDREPLDAVVRSAPAAPQARRRRTSPSSQRAARPHARAGPGDGEPTTTRALARREKELEIVAELASAPVAAVGGSRPCRRLGGGSGAWPPSACPTSSAPRSASSTATSCRLPAELVFRRRRG